MLDVWLPGMDGLATLARLRERQVDAQVVLISGHGNIESAVQGDQARRIRLRREAALARQDACWSCGTRCASGGSKPEPRAAARVDRTQTMVGESHAMRQLREQIAMAAPTNGRVLIYGENGTGKELVARTIHALSRAPHGAVRRGQLRGDPGGADRERAVRPREGRLHRRRRRPAGKFELADGGTLFLDEIGDMSLKTQAKVLRVLQEQTMEPVGGTTRSTSTRACSRPPTRICRPRSAPAASARTSTSA